MFKLSQKKRLGIKFTIWLLTIKTYGTWPNDVWLENAIGHWKYLIKGYNFAFETSLIKIHMWELWVYKTARFIFWQNLEFFNYNFGTPRIFVILMQSPSPISKYSIQKYNNHLFSNLCHGVFNELDCPWFFCGHFDSNLH